MNSILIGSKLVLFFWFFISIVILSSCAEGSKKKSVVDFGVVDLENQDLETFDNDQVFIAIASMTSPRETIIYYDQLIHYLSEKLGQTILIKQRKTYSEVNDLLKNGEVDFAFICSGAYGELSKTGKVSLLVAPQINGRTFYRAYIIVNQNTVVDSFEGLSGKSFGFTDPLSHTGYMFPLQILENMGTNPRIYFSNTIFTHGHDISIEMVNRNVLDGASVHGLIFDYLSEIKPDRVKNVNVIKKSDWFGIPPIVIPVSLEKEKIEKYRNIFLDIHKDSIGKGILENLKIDSFVLVKDSIYDSVRIMKEHVDH
ncbi:MAG: phosphate/phosphite/phosphonate ABC transporter substrate-binding protein [Bacteroidetes bacterium]|nr:MAG: phosphate/phosphite/phosphonate ABC transporter substrate-binding protein [Bacteroidota bacterium]